MTARTLMLFSHICNPNHMTGAEKLLHFMLRELVPYHRTLLVVPNEGMLAARARSLGVEVIVHPYPLLWEMWNPGPSFVEQIQHFRQPQQLSALMNLMHMHRPDIVGVNTCVNPLPAMAASQLGIPVMWMITEVLQGGPYSPHATQLIASCARWIVGISETALAPFRRDGFAAQTMLLSPSWHPDQLRPDTWPTLRHKLRLTCGIGRQELCAGYVVSDIALHKGFDHFVEMAVRLCHTHPHVQYMIVGNPTEQAYYDHAVAYIHSSGFASRFKMIPFHTSIEAIYPALDLLVVPSMVPEGFGMTAMEGMIFGKPVIAYRSGGLEEMLTNVGRSQWLVPLGDIDSLTALAAELLRDRRTCLAMGQEVQRSVQEVYGIEAYRLRLKQLLSAIEPSAAALEQHYAHVRAVFSDGMLVKGGHTPAVFLLQGGRKRPFASEGAFHGNGFSWHDVQILDEALLQAWPTGLPIH